MTNPWAARRGLTAILITVPELADFTHRWRSVSHSSARPEHPLTELIPPHVTVLIPWVAEPAPADLERLAKAVAGFGPFELTFRQAGQFPNGTSWLRPEPYDQIQELLHAVYEAFPECPPYGGQFPESRPHLTIAASGTGGPDVVAEAQAALDSAPPAPVRISKLGWWSEDSDGVWSERDWIPLASGQR